VTPTGVDSRGSHLTSCPADRPAYSVLALSFVIGVLLVGGAISLGFSSKRNLIGEAIPESVRDGITKVINESAGVDVVVELLTMRLGPGDVLVAARVDVDDAATGDGRERLADDVDHPAGLPRGAPRLRPPLQGELAGAALTVFSLEPGRHHRIPRECGMSNSFRVWAGPQRGIHRAGDRRPVGKEA
jgi:hypothetical protein